MSELDRIRNDIRNLEAIERGLRENVTRALKALGQLERDRASAGLHYDAILRQGSIDARIRGLRSDIQSAEREINRVRNQLRGLEANLRRNR